MPTLEMALFVENIYYGIRRCFATENDYPLKSSSFRCDGGADWVGANQRRFRCYHSETNSRSRSTSTSRCSSSSSDMSLSEFVASTDYILQQEEQEQESCAQTLCSMQPVDSRYQLHASASGLAAALHHGQCQRKIWQLQRRSLMENAREVIGIQCASWWSRYTPDLRALSVDSSLDFLARKLTSEQRQPNEPEPEIMVYIREFVNLCRRIFQAADTVISDALCFKASSSASLDVLNINELIPDLNSALIQYLLSLEEPTDSNSF